MPGTHTNSLQIFDPSIVDLRNIASDDRIVVTNDWEFSGDVDFTGTFSGVEAAGVAAALDAAHVAAPDPHTQYQLRSEKGVSSGYASLDAGGFLVEAAQVIRETGDPTSLSVGAIADGEVLVRSGGTITGTAAPPPGPHASAHSDGGSDEIDAADLGSGAAGAGTVLTADGAGGNSYGTVSTTDELVGISAADTTPGFLNSKIVGGSGINTSILNPGADEDLELVVNQSVIDHVNLLNIGTNTHAQIDTHIADTANPHATDLGNLGSGTLAELNAAVTDATLDDSSASRTPLAHATSHQHLGSDEIAVASAAANAIPKAGGAGTLADGWIAASNVTQHEGSINHDALLNYAVAQHRIINDAGTSTVELWSADKISTEISTVVAGVDIKAGVDTTTTDLGNITLSGEQTLNGLLTSTSRVLVTEQTLPQDNGIYITAAGAWTRATDADEDAEVTNGNIVHVINSGSTKYKYKYLLVTADPITVGTTGQAWEEHRDIDFGTTAGTAAEGNDSRIPTQDENDALVGTGAPSAANVYVTNDTFTAHTGSAFPHSGTLAQLNLAVTDATLIANTRNLTAGAGMTGGGDLSADRTFDVVANADGSMVVNANDIQVGVLATDAQHGARGGGTQHAVATGAVAGFMSAADKTAHDAHLVDTSNPHSVTLQQAFDAGGSVAVTGNPLALTSTTHGFGLMAMTEVQRDAIGTLPTGLLIFNTDAPNGGQVEQYNGSAWTTPGAGFTTLQGAYDNDPTGAQIILDATPNPLTVEASVAGTVFEARDTSSFALLGISDTTISLGKHDTIVSTAAASAIEIVSDAPNTLQFWPSDRTFTSAPGSLIRKSNIEVHDYANVSMAVLNLQNTAEHAQSGFAFNHALIFNHGTTYRNSLNVAANYGPVQGFIDQPTIQVYRTSAGMVTMGQLRSFLSQPRFSRGSTNGTLAVTNVTNFQAFGNVQVGATITNWTRLQCGPFAAPTSGTITNYRAIDIVNETQPTAIITGLRSQIASGGGGTRRNLEITGTAISTFAGDVHMNNSVSLVLGSVGVNGVELFRPSAGVLRMIGVGGTNNEGLDWDFDTATADTIDVQSSTGAGLGLNLPAVSIGTTAADPTSNWQLLLSPGAKTITIGGDFSRALFSASANVTVNAALSNLSTWTINEPAVTIGTGSVVNGANLIVQTSVAVGTNRYGLLVTSNPSGGTLNYCARFSGAAGVRVDGILEHTGATAGLYGATPVVQAADIGALTLTTHSGSPNTTLVDVSGTGDDATINDNLHELGLQINALRTLLRNLGPMA